MCFESMILHSEIWSFPSKLIICFENCVLLVREYERFGETQLLASKLLLGRWKYDIFEEIKLVASKYEFVDRKIILWYISNKYNR